MTTPNRREENRRSLGMVAWTVRGPEQRWVLKLGAKTRRKVPLQNSLTTWLQTRMGGRA